MENPFKLGSNEHGAKSTALLLTARMFFGLEGDEAYTSPTDFLIYGESLRSKEGSDLTKIVDGMLNGQRMNGNPITGVDAGGRPYTWHQIYKAKAVSGFKVINGGGMPKLINDYQDGKIIINFTLIDLIKVAREA